MKVPTKLWGNTAVLALMRHDQVASMKAPPKRKGNPQQANEATQPPSCLNESPSEKEGKFATESPAGRFPDEPQ